MFDQKTHDEVVELLKWSNIMTNNELFLVRQDPDCGQVIAACWVGYYAGTVEFDIVVFEDFQGQGIAKEFVQEVIDTYEEIAKEFYAQCVNPAMSHILEKHFGFYCERQIGDRKDMFLDN